LSPIIEAGHAVAAVNLRLKLDAVTIAASTEARPRTPTGDPNCLESYVYAGIVPHLVLLALGFVVRWIGRGFRSRRATFASSSSMRFTTSDSRALVLASRPRKSSRTLMQIALACVNRVAALLSSCGVMGMAVLSCTCCTSCATSPSCHAGPARVNGLSCATWPTALTMAYACRFARTERRACARHDDCIRGQGH